MTRRNAPPRHRPSRAAAALLEAVKQHPTPQSGDPALRLLTVIHALERNALPTPDDLSWLLAGLKAYANQTASPPLALDWHLGLTPTEREGPGSKVARVAMKFRDGQYRLRMTLYLEAGYSSHEAARRAIDDLAPVLHGAALPLAGLASSKPLRPATLERMFRAWKAQPTFEKDRAAMALVHAEEIERIRQSGKREDS